MGNFLVSLILCKLNTNQGFDPPTDQGVCDVTACEEKHLIITMFVLQNLAEAEYVVALFMYMRLLGYPKEKVSILTTYNGQKHLIRDVIAQRCRDNPLIGMPHKVSTNIVKHHFTSKCVKLKKL